MQGTRVYYQATSAEGHHWLVDSPLGAYGKNLEDGNWYVHCPNGDFGNLGNHTVIEHEDGTITVSPSIAILNRDGSFAYHGMLERGVWRDA